MHGEADAIRDRERDLKMEIDRLRRELEGSPSVAAYAASRRGRDLISNN